MACSWLHDFGVPGKRNHKHSGGNCTQLLRHIIGPRYVRVVGPDHSGDPRSAVRDRVIERTVRIPTHHRTVESRTEMVDRPAVEQCALEDEDEVSGPILRQQVDPSAELAAKPGSEHRLSKGGRSEPGRIPRTPVEYVDGTSGPPKCSNQGVAQSGFFPLSHDDDPNHARHLSS